MFGFGGAWYWQDYLFVLAIAGALIAWGYHLLWGGYKPDGCGGGCAVASFIAAAFFLFWAAFQLFA